MELSRGLLQGIRVILTIFYLFLVLITIPISFRVGGVYCGLSFTVTLFNLYFITTTTKVLFGNGNTKALTGFIYYGQHFLIPSLLFLFLSRFNNDELKRSDIDPQKFLMKLLQSGEITTNTKWAYYCYYKYLVKPWQFLLLHSTSYFTLLEGFFTVLAIQAIGETNRWLSYKKNSNIWIITSLMISGGLITASLYYLYRIYAKPIWELSVQTASLLGFTFSIICVVGLFGIISGRGSVIESSLFFAYMIRCIYEISPKLATSAMDEILNILNEVWKSRQGNLTKENLLNHYGNAVLKNGELLWSTIIEKTSNKSVSLDSTSLISQLLPIWNFIKNFSIKVPGSIQEVFLVTLKMARESVTPAVVTNLVFRILVFYSATRIIPALQSSIYHDKKSRKLMELIYWYSPCIVIAMYTHLILRYSGELNNDLCIWGCLPYQDLISVPIIVDAWSFWNWCNVFFTMIVYAMELIGSK